MSIESSGCPDSRSTSAWIARAAGSSGARSSASATARLRREHVVAAVVLDRATQQRVRVPDARVDEERSLGDRVDERGECALDVAAVERLAAASDVTPRVGTGRHRGLEFLEGASRARRHPVVRIELEETCQVAECVERAAADADE